MQDLQDVIISKLKPIDLDNVHRILNMAHLHDKAELKKVCYSFLEENPSEFLSGKFCDLTQVLNINYFNKNNKCVFLIIKIPRRIKAKKQIMNKQE